MSEPLYHILDRDRWERALAEGHYDGDTLATEGFIHASTSTQLASTAARHFAGRVGLVVLRIDPDLLTAPIRWEPAPGSAELFPHIYGPLDLAAVVEISPMT